MANPEKVDVKSDIHNQNATGYEGASGINRELALWSPPLVSADAALLSDKDEMDARSLDLQRNNSYINGAVQSQKDSIVGSFYRLNLKPNFKVLGLGEKWAEEFQEFVEHTFSLAADSPECWFDIAGKLTFPELIKLSLGVSCLAGESLATCEWSRETGRPFKTAIQMIDPIRLGNPYGEPDNSFWRKGVKFSKQGKPLQYSIRYSMPGDIWSMEDNYRWKIVDARKPWGRKQVLHYFESHRPDQSRGVNEMVAILKQSKMLGKYQDIVLQNAILNATYAATIESDLPPAEAFDTLGAGEDHLNSWAMNYLKAIAAYTGNSKNLHIDGVKVPHLYPGTKLNLMNAGSPGGIGDKYEQSLIRSLAVQFGMSYEEFSHDFTNTNYSSFKAASIDTQKRQQGKKKLVADRMATDIFRLWFEEQMNSGGFSDVLPRNAPSIYEGLNFEAYTSCSWIGAPKGQVDELKETEAAVLRIRNNLSTYEKECARFGDDFREVFRQRYREMKMQEEYNLIVEDKPVKSNKQVQDNGQSEDDRSEETPSE